MAAPALHGTSQGLTRLHGVHGASQDFTATLELLGVHRASPLSPVLVTWLTLVTALVTALVTRFSSNSYVFL